MYEKHIFVKIFDELFFYKKAYSGEWNERNNRQTHERDDLCEHINILIKFNESFFGKNQFQVDSRTSELKFKENSFEVNLLSCSEFNFFWWKWIWKIFIWIMATEAKILSGLEVAKWVWDIFRGDFKFFFVKFPKEVG